MFLPSAKNAMALFVGICAAGLILEIGLRMTGRFRSQGIHTVSEQDYWRIPGPWEPNQDYVDNTNTALPYHSQTNSLGLRGPETTLKPDGPRILVIGDSFTFGEYVDNEDTLPANLGARLSGRAEVLNAGVLGSTIVDQRVFLQRLLDLDPTLVLLVFCENDLHDLQATLPLHIQLENNRKLKSGFLRPFYLAFRHTALFNLYLRRHSLFGWPFWEEQDTAVAAEDVSSPAVDSETTRRDFAKRYAMEAAAMRTTLAQRGIDLLVATFPGYDTMSGEALANPVDLVIEELERVDIHAVDLRPDLRRAEPKVTPLYLLPYDPHPSPRAYSVAADTLTPHVLAALNHAAAP